MLCTKLGHYGTEMVHIVMMKLCALKDCPDYLQYNSIMVTFCHDLNIGESAVVLWNKTKVL